MVTTVITAMAAYSNERVAAIILSVLYRMLTMFLQVGNFNAARCVPTGGEWMIIKIGCID